MGLTAAVIGAGPAGLMAAETLAHAGLSVAVYERMPTPARKFLMAGRGGLNLTHCESFERFAGRYHQPGPLHDLLSRFPPDALREWAHGLGIETFEGTSGRVFPRGLKSSPLLRAWVRRLAGQGVVLHTRHDWRGWWPDGALDFETPGGRVAAVADVTVLALGGASWPRLGSDGGWAGVLAARGVPLEAFAASNCGVVANWPDGLRAAAEGQPLKRIAVSCGGRSVRGEAMITALGLEGGAVYALAPEIRAALAATGETRLEIDLRPDIAHADLVRKLAAVPARVSLSNRLRRAAGLSPAASAVWRYACPREAARDADSLATSLKAVPVTVTALAPMARAISTAGGIDWRGLDDSLMLTALPGVFAAGEMIAWDAPTGGYLLQACFATGRAAGEGAAGWARQEARPVG